MRAMMCGSHGSAAAERDAVSRGVVSECRLRCLDRSAVDTRAKFASPSGAPPGYVCCSPIGEALPGLAEQERRSSAPHRVVSASRRAVLV